MKVWNGFAISGMRLIDEEGEHIVDLNWSGVGAWATQEIPEGNEIIGLKCNTSKYHHAIPRIGIILWTPHFTEENEHLCRQGW